MSDLDRLSALLVQQAELSAQREERLAGMLERLMSRPPSAAPDTPGVADGQASAAAAAAARPPMRMPASATPAPHLTSSASLRDFTVWKEKFHGYMMLTGAATLPVEGQRAVLLSLLDEDWHRVIRYGVGVAEDAALETVVGAMEGHLRKQRNVLVDRRDFYARAQEPGECFDDFLCAIKEIASFCAFCEQCMDSRLRDRVVCGARDEDAVRRMLEEPGLTLQRAVDICRANENARATCEDIRGTEDQSVLRLSAYRQGRSQSRGPRPPDRSHGGQCQRCGRDEHAQADMCRAIGATCRACGKVGHFAAVCRQPAGAGPTAAGAAAPPLPDSARGSAARRGQSAQPGRGIQRVISDVYINGVCTHPAPTVEIQLRHPAGDSSLRCTPDSGAEATVMGEDIALSIGIDVSRLSVDMRTNFTAVGRRPLDCLGAFSATLRLGSRSVDVTVYVIRQLTGVLISWFDSIALGILPADFPAQIRHAAALSLERVQTVPSVTLPGPPAAPVSTAVQPTCSADAAAAAAATAVAAAPPHSGPTRRAAAQSTQQACDSAGLSPQPVAALSPLDGDARLEGQLPTWSSDADPSKETIAAHTAAIVAHYPRVFSAGGPLREMEGGPMVIELREDATPTASHRRPSDPVRLAGGHHKAQLDELQARGVIAPVDYPTDWCHPMVAVAKRPSGVRLCVDLTRLNRFVKRPTYPVRPPHDAVTGIPAGCRWMTTLDAAMGYFQVPLAEPSQDLTCFITPWGRMKFLRAPQGCVSAGDEYNLRGDKALGDIPNTVKVVDDLLAYDTTYRAHLAHVIAVIQRCDERGITLNPKKFVFARHEVNYCGYRITPDGYTSDGDKLKAIAEFPRPENVTDLRSFMGLTNQLGGLSSELAHAAEPLRDLLKARHLWCWTAQHEVAFLRVKAVLAAPPVMAFFDPSLPTTAADGRRPDQRARLRPAPAPRRHLAAGAVWLALSERHRVTVRRGGDRDGGGAVGMPEVPQLPRRSAALHAGRRSPSAGPDSQPEATERDRQSPATADEGEADAVFAHRQLAEGIRSQHTGRAVTRSDQRPDR